MRNAALHFLVGRSAPVAGRSAGRPPECRSGRSCLV